VTRYRRRRCRRMSSVFEDSSSDLDKKFNNWFELSLWKISLKNVLKSVKITVNECGRDFSANKLCIYIRITTHRHQTGRKETSSTVQHVYHINTKLIYIYKCTVNLPIYQRINDLYVDQCCIFIDYKYIFDR
jgi:hypothetical protein